MQLRRDIDKPKKDILALSAVVEDSVRKAVLAAENRDGKMAQNVIEGDKQIDAMEVDLERIEENPEHLSGLIQWLSVSRYLERIADQATNIAEDVIYMLKGEIVRHQGDDFEK